MDATLARPVAVKLLRAEHLHNAETLLRFRAEAQRAAALCHPGIAQIHDYGEADPPNPPYLVMELVPGPSLAGLLASNGRLAPAHATDVIAQTAAGLHAAHVVGLVHRDIKPANLLLDAQGRVKITDFGISHAVGTAPVTLTGLVVGTPAYLAPERVVGAQATPAADLYSLGIVAYELLTGHVPFTGAPLEVAAAHREHSLPPLPYGVPAAVAKLVAELAAKDPAARPASAGEVAVRAAGLHDDLVRAGGAVSLRDTSPRVASHVPRRAPRLAARFVPSQTARRVPGLAPGRGSRRVPGLGVPTVLAFRPGFRSRSSLREVAQAGTPTLADMPLRAASAPAGSRRLPPGARRTRGARRFAALAGAACVVLALLAVVAVGGIFAGPGPGPAPSPAARQPGSSVPSIRLIAVNGGSLIGQPVSFVRQLLRDRGLVVRVIWRRTSQEAAGTVVSVSPSGKVPVGGTVVVTGALRRSYNGTARHFTVKPAGRGPRAGHAGPYAGTGGGPGRGHGTGGRGNGAVVDGGGTVDGGGAGGGNSA